jgi:hypothetical protein
VEVTEDAREGRGPLQGLAAGLAAIDGRLRRRRDGPPDPLERRSRQGDRAADDNVTRQPAHGDRRLSLERLVALQVAGLDLLAHGDLDLTLGGHSELLEELPHRHVEGFLVDPAPSRRVLIDRAPP